MNPFSQMMTDNLTLEKKDGETINNIKASVQSKKIYIVGSNILIETGDLLHRKMSNGGEETYKVIDPGFQEEILTIPASYDITYKKLGLPEAKKAMQKITYNTVTIHGDHRGNTQVGNSNIMNNSEFNNKFTQLIQEIESSSIGNKVQIIQELNEKKEDNKSLKLYLYSLLPVVSDVASVVSAIGALLGAAG